MEFRVSIRLTVTLVSEWYNVRGGLPTLCNRCGLVLRAVLKLLATGDFTRANPLTNRIQLLLVMMAGLLLAACGGSATSTGIVSNDTAAAAEGISGDGSDTQVVLHTSAGDIRLSLDSELAPLTVENFLLYAGEGHYDGTVFHRVIEGFMIQGGGFTTDYIQKPTYDPVANEADNGLKNTRYSIAMARTSDPHSATSQFFINVEDNTFLNYTAPTNAGWGYAVFGYVIAGYDTVDRIAATATGADGPFARDVPLQPVVINSVAVQ